MIFGRLITTLEGIGDCSHVVVFYDEVFSLFDDTGRMPDEFRSFFTQMRKRHITLLTSSQLWSKLPKEFRDLCRYEVSCRIFSPWWLPFSILINEFNDGYAIHWDDSQQMFIAPRLWTSYKKMTLRVSEAYDTFETIEHARSYKSTSAGYRARTKNRGGINELF